MVLGEFLPHTRHNVHIFKLWTYFRCDYLCKAWGKMENRCFPMPIEAVCMVQLVLYAPTNSDRLWIVCKHTYTQRAQSNGNQTWWHSIYLTQSNISNHFIFMWFVNLSCHTSLFDFIPFACSFAASFAFYFIFFHCVALIACRFRFEHANILNELFPIERDLLRDSLHSFFYSVWFLAYFFLLSKWFR